MVPNDLLSTPRDLPQFGKSAGNLARSSAEVFGGGQAEGVLQGDGSCGCSGGSACHCGSGCGGGCESCAGGRPTAGHVRRDGSWSGRNRDGLRSRLATVHVHSDPRGGQLGPIRPMQGSTGWQPPLLPLAGPGWPTYPRAQCCCIVDIKLVKGTPVYETAYLGLFQEGTVSFHVEASTEWRWARPHEDGALCSGEWWEISDSSQKPRGYRNWGMGQWNNATDEVSVAGDQATEMAEDQEHALSFYSREGALTRSGPIGFGDSPARWDVWPGSVIDDSKVLIYMEFTSGCSACKSCCVLVFMDWSTWPPTTRFRAACGEGCSKPEAGGHYGPWRDTGVHYGVISRRDYFPPDIGGAFAGAGHLGPENTISWDPPVVR